MGKWDKVFESKQQVRAEIVKALLEEHDIPAVVMNKKETVYHVFGYYEVHVPNENLMKASNIIANEISF